MFLRAALAEKFQLSNNDVFRWREDHCFPLELSSFFATERPRIHFISPGQIEICFEASVHVKDVELPPMLTRKLGEKYLHGRYIEISRWKNLCKLLDVSFIQKDEKIHIVGKPGL